MRKCALILVFAAALPAAVVLDRIAVTIGKNVITANQVKQEIRLTAFMNGETPDFSAAAKKQAAERLIDQSLIRTDMQASGWPQPETSEADRLVAQLKRERFGSSDTEYRRALERYGITDAQLRQHLLWQLAALRYTDFRFQPNMPQPTEALKQVEDAAQTRSARNASRSHPPGSDDQIHFGRNPSPRTDVSGTITASKLQAGAHMGQPTPETVDAQMDAWLKEARSRSRITYHEEAFQ